MYLLRLPGLPSAAPVPSSPPSKSLSLLFRTFEDSVAALLGSLLAPAPAEASFSFLARAVGVLSSVHALVDALLSDPSLSGSEEPALAAYVDSSINLLDVCNAISKEVERRNRGRLLLLFAAHLLSSGVPSPPGKVSKAREAIAEWEVAASSDHGVSASALGLIRDLAGRDAPPRGRATALGRAVYAVDAISALIAGAVATALGGGVDLAAGTKVSDDFAWGKAFNELRAALSGEIRGSRPEEARHVEESARSLAEILDAPDKENKAALLLNSVRELEDATEKLTEGLDRLGSAINGLFRRVLGTRNTALQGFRLRPNKCK